MASAFSRNEGGFRNQSMAVSIDLLVRMSGSANGVIRWPLLLGGSLEGAEASMICDGVVSKQAGQNYLALSGELNFSYNGYAGSASVSDFHLN